MCRGEGTLFDLHYTYCAAIVREEGNNGDVYYTGPQFYHNVFLLVMGTRVNFIGWIINLNVQTFQRLSVICRKGNSM